MILTAVGRLLSPALTGRRRFIADRRLDGLPLGTSWERWENELVAGESDGREPARPFPNDDSSSSPTAVNGTGDETKASRDGKDGSV